MTKVYKYENGKKVELKGDELAAYEVNSKECTAEAELVAHIYARAPEYPAIGDQLDAIMKWLATETEIGIPKELKSIAMQCMAVKSKHPKKG